MKNILKVNLKNILTLLFSILLSSIYVIGTNVNYTTLFGKINEIYVDGLSIIQIVFIIIISIILYILFSLLTEFYDKKICNFLFSEDSQYNFKKIIVKWVLLVLLINLFWIPYYLAYYPGNIFSDGFTSIEQALSTGINNHHTLLYSYYISIFAHIGNKIHNFNSAIFLYTLIQSVIMSGILSYFIVWLSKYNIHPFYRILCFLFFCFFPLYPFYAMTMWKDTFFSLALFLYILFLIDFCTEKIELNKKSTLFYFLIISFLVCFLRNNGIYIVIFTVLFFIIFYFKQLKLYKKFLIWNIIFISFTIIIQGPVYSILGLKESFVESIAISMQQIGAVVSYDGNYNQEYISKIWNIEEIKEKYTPALADTMKWYMNDFNLDYLNSTKISFIKNWMKIVIKNPKIVIDAFLLENLGFWHLTYQDSFSYIQVGVWENDYNVERNDILYEKTHISIDQYVVPKKYISAGLLFWIVMLSALICFRMMNIMKVLPYIPVIGLWLTIMIATPVAFSLRYVYILVLLIPLLFVLPGILKRYDKE